MVDGKVHHPPLHGTTINDCLASSHLNQDMDFHNVPPVDIKVRDLSLAIEPSPPLFEKLGLRRPQVREEKRILHDISLDVPSGSLMAIIGASGSGKTSLLNLMASRVAASGRMKMEGRIEYNGGSLRDIQHAYVIQQDNLLRMNKLHGNANSSGVDSERDIKVRTSLMRVADIGTLRPCD